MTWQDHLWKFLSDVVLNMICMTLMVIVPFCVGTVVGETMGLMWAMIAAVIVYFLQLGVLLRIAK